MLHIKRYLISNEIFKVVQSYNFFDIMHYISSSELITVDINKHIYIYDMYDNKSIIKAKIDRRTKFNMSMTSETMALLYLISELDSEYIDIYIENDKLCFVGTKIHHGTCYNKNNETEEYYAISERTIRIPIQIWNCTM